VAIDVARMLVLDRGELATTDTADHALEALLAASVEEVVVLGRRGPAQAAFTNPELRELGELARADVVVDPAEVELDDESSAWLASDAADATARRNVGLLRDYAQRPAPSRTHRIVLRFLRSPVEILGDGRGAVAALRVVRNRVERGDGGALRAVATDEHETIACGLVIRSIGYRGNALDGVPFDARRGLVSNDGGRVRGADGTALPGEYAVGWIKRGPSGVIGTNKKDAADTVARILEDRDAARLNEPTDADPNAAAARLAALAPGLVTWKGWTTIDAHERAAGEPRGRPRVKVVRMARLREVAGSA
jgi:ferredoxin/flavodoxin---NADP+ reductase